MGLFTRDIKTMDDLFVHQLKDIYYAEHEPLRVCRRPQLLRGWGYGHEEEDVEQIFT